MAAVLDFSGLVPFVPCFLFQICRRPQLIFSLLFHSPCPVTSTAAFFIFFAASEDIFCFQFCVNL